MNVLTKALNIVLLILFAESLLFVPIVLLIAAAGNDLTRIMKYVFLFLAALLPYLVWRMTMRIVPRKRFGILVVISGLIGGTCFLLFFSGILLASCAGHPPL